MCVSEFMWRRQSCLLRPDSLGRFLRTATKVEMNLDPAGMNARATGADYRTSGTMCLAS
jgi:hypothetical protein